MEACGFIALMILIYCYSYPGRVQKLEKKVKKLEQSKNLWQRNKEEKEENKMSRLVQDLVGKKCRVETEDDTFVLAGSGLVVCDVLDADDDWVKLAYEDKKNGRITKLVRIDTIVTVDIVEGN